MFTTAILDIDNCFEKLSELIFESNIKNRKEAVLVDNKNGLIPIVRTTSTYNNPAQQFLPIHFDLMDKIRSATSTTIIFNNALIEIYGSEYRTMKYHTDHTLDLADDSYICLFSCYDNPTTPRKLQIKNKITLDEEQIILQNNSIVLFSVDTNQKHLHKIIYDGPKSNALWLGITFRLSKQNITFIDNLPYFYHSMIMLRIANIDERKEFYKHKQMENQSTNYKYPVITYTISPSDLKPIDNSSL